MKIPWLREPWDEPDYYKWYATLTKSEKKHMENLEDICDDWAGELDGIFETLKDKLRFDVFRELTDWRYKQRANRVSAKQGAQAAFLDGLMHEYAESQSDELKAVFRRVVQHELNSGSRLLYVNGPDGEPIARPDDWRMVGHLTAATMRMHPDFSFTWLLDTYVYQIQEESR